MSKLRHRARGWSWLVAMATVLGLGLTTPPLGAQAAPIKDFPALPLDPSAMVAQVGPQVVNINTRLGYNNAVGAGTGIVIDPNGVVLTNNHVISGATDISAFSVGDGRTYGVDVVGYDRTQDVAVLQLRGAGGSPTAAIGGGVSIGEPIVALGNTGGAGGTPVRCPAAWSRSARRFRRRTPDRRRRDPERVDPGRRGHRAR